MIPKILHQIWIGPKEPPIKLMKTWKEKHPEFRYILWNEEELQRSGIRLVCHKQIQAMAEINGFGGKSFIKWAVIL